MAATNTISVYNLPFRVLCLRLFSIPIFFVNFEKELFEPFEAQKENVNGFCSCHGFFPPKDLAVQVLCLPIVV